MFCYINLCAGSCVKTGKSKVSIVQKSVGMVDFGVLFGKKSIIGSGVVCCSAKIRNCVIMHEGAQGNHNVLPQV